MCSLDVLLSKISQVETENFCIDTQTQIVHVTNISLHSTVYCYLNILILFYYLFR